MNTKHRYRAPSIRGFARAIMMLLVIITGIPIATGWEIPHSMSSAGVLAAHVNHFHTELKHMIGSGVCLHTGRMIDQLTKVSQMRDIAGEFRSTARSLKPTVDRQYAILNVIGTDKKNLANAEADLNAIDDILTEHAGNVFSVLAKTIDDKRTSLRRRLSSLDGIRDHDDMPLSNHPVPKAIYTAEVQRHTTQAIEKLAVFERKARAFFDSLPEIKTRDKKMAVTTASDRSRVAMLRLQILQLEQHLITSPHHDNADNRLEELKTIHSELSDIDNRTDNTEVKITTAAALAEATGLTRYSIDPVTPVYLDTTPSIDGRGANLAEIGGQPLQHHIFSGSSLRE